MSDTAGGPTDTAAETLQEDSSCVDSKSFSGDTSAEALSPTDSNIPSNQDGSKWGVTISVCNEKRDATERTKTDDTDVFLTPEQQSDSFSAASQSPDAIQISDAVSKAEESLTSSSREVHNETPVESCAAEQVSPDASSFSTPAKFHCTESENVTEGTLPKSATDISAAMSTAQQSTESTSAATASPKIDGVPMPASSDTSDTAPVTNSPPANTISLEYSAYASESIIETPPVETRSDGSTTTMNVPEGSIAADQNAPGTSESEVADSSVEPLRADSNIESIQHLDSTSTSLSSKVEQGASELSSESGKATDGPNALYGSLKPTSDSTTGSFGAESSPNANGTEYQNQESWLKPTLECSASQDAPTYTLKTSDSSSVEIMQNSNSVLSPSKTEGGESNSVHRISLSSVKPLADETQRLKTDRPPVPAPRKVSTEETHQNNSVGVPSFVASTAEYASKASSARLSLSAVSDVSSKKASRSSVPANFGATQSYFTEEAKLKKKKKKRSVQTVFESQPAPTVADFSALRPTGLTARGTARTVFESVAIQSKADASANTLNFKLQQTVYESESAPSKCDASAHLPATSSAARTVFESLAVPSKADATATSSQSSLPNSQKASVFESQPKSSDAHARAGETLASSIISRTVYESETGQSSANFKHHAPALQKSREEVKYSFESVPQSSGASVRWDAKTHGSSQQSSVFESQPTTSTAFVKWNAQPHIQQKRTVFESNPVPRVADAAADKSLSDDESDTGSDSEAEGEREDDTSAAKKQDSMNTVSREEPQTEYTIDKDIDEAISQASTVTESPTEEAQLVNNWNESVSPVGEQTH